MLDRSHIEPIAGMSSRQIAVNALRFGRLSISIFFSLQDGSTRDKVLRGLLGNAMCISQPSHHDTYEYYLSAYIQSREGS
jgi:hypothetical protein